MSDKSPRLSRAYIGLGSNVGDREEYLREAFVALRRLGEVGAASLLYETAAVGPIPQPDFLNAVAELRTEMLPEELLKELLYIEKEHGRDRSAGLPKGPRTLDLDLLAYDDVVLDTPSLTLPHPALSERLFVLIPLAEIAPEWRHPLNGKTASELLLELGEKPGDGVAAVYKFSSSQLP
jgi:2-amino-4-hydroxy-6-hydroxymethyldihydropteridine diphosphokinase